MSENRRRQARIQGSGWAPSQKPKSVLRKTEHADVKEGEMVQPHVIDGYPAWTAKNVDSPPQKGFVYHQPTEEDLRRKPPDQEIDSGGVYDLSSSDKGVSRLVYYPDFLTLEQADEALASLMDEIHWKQKTNKKQGVTYDEPRLTAWFGDVPYRYSGVLQEANPDWPATVKAIKDKVEEVTGIRYNSMLANYYRDGKDSIDWHADNEPALGENPVIASLSLGETRNFELRQNPGPDEPRTHDGRLDYTYMRHVRIPLTHGSLLLMQGATQHDWQHRVPKEYHDKGGRINLTFRNIYSQTK